MGHMPTHLAHLMQLCGVFLTEPLRRISRIPDVPLVTGASGLATARPIIGPPFTILPVSSGIPPPYSISDEIGVPILTFRFAVWDIARPVTVTTRSISGLFFCTASYTAKVVPAFCTTAPTSIGRPPEGTSRPSTASISCFSPPCG